MTQHAWLQARFAGIRPQALAALTRQFRNIDLAEEAFANACVRALQTWPRSGMPNDPLAWLLKVGRNAGIDIIRKNQRLCELTLPPTDAEDMENLYAEQLDNDGLRDDVLRLLFICCHPSLSPQDQLAVALKTIAGMSVAQIAGAFVVRPKAMEQRLTRARRTMTTADISFETPDMTERGRRLKTVCLMLYLLFNEGWSASSGEIQIKQPLCEEAIRLTRLLLELFPGIGDLMGLLALFLFQHSRRDARLDAEQNLVPLDDQDRRLWDHSMIAEARVLLEKALRRGPSGPFQLQAAIASVHSLAPAAQHTDWHELVRLYGLLYAIQPTPIIRLNQAVAVEKIKGPEAALAMLRPLGADLQTYRWYHAVCAAFLFDLEQFAEAKAAYETALRHNPTAAERRILKDKIMACEKNS
uniref:RNA polymerase sigma factor n=1 Tax=Pararhizobium sp. IMCC3301 TaxID=3067904 RepID=UPI0027427E72|nr:RNA polymerase sigma factor [Pararhizobium sp. IMCC3301]